MRNMIMLSLRLFRLLGLLWVIIVAVGCATTNVLPDKESSIKPRTKVIEIRGDDESIRPVSNGNVFPTTIHELYFPKGSKGHPNRTIEIRGVVVELISRPGDTLVRLRMADDTILAVYNNAVVIRLNSCQVIRLEKNLGSFWKIGMVTDCP